MRPHCAELEVIDLGVMEYSRALSLQRDIVRQRIEGKTGDHLLLVEHPPVITIGRTGSTRDLVLPEECLLRENITIFQSDRGGKVTFHSPGQLVAYPIISLRNKDTHWYVNALLNVVADVLREYGLKPVFKEGSPGVWIEKRKIASIGIAVKKWVTFHGIALNVNTELSGFDFIIPCGMRGQEITSMEKELDSPQDLVHVKERFIHYFKRAFGFDELGANMHPKWLTLPPHSLERFERMKDFLQEMCIETVCQSAHCPNIGECYSKGIATFMILGGHCTRSCRFCAVEKGAPSPPDSDEPRRVAKAVKERCLKYSVITSVTRDDLQDGGASFFINTINEIRTLCPETLIEILAPDFQGMQEVINRVCQARPDMFNHNIETVARLYPFVRPQAKYERSLRVLATAMSHGLPVKSGMMLGLGESRDEVKRTLDDLLKAGCDFVTLGQYLAPSKQHIPVARYVLPEEFEEWRRTAMTMGFKGAASGPLVRSSYRAEEFFRSWDRAIQRDGAKNTCNTSPSEHLYGL